MDYLLTELTRRVKAHPPPPEVHALALVALVDMYRNLPPGMRAAMPARLQTLCEATNALINNIEERRNDG